MTYSYNENTGRYIVKNAQIQFVNFSGLETDFNAAGKRNFKLIIDEALADELQEQGVRVTELRRRDDTEPVRFSVKIGVYGTSDMFLCTGNHVEQELDLETCKIIDMEMRKGHIQNGQVKLSFHVSQNTRLPNPVTYLRLDSIYIPITHDELADEFDFDEDDVFEEA